MTEILNSAVSVFPVRLKAPLLRAASILDDIQEIRFVCDKSVYFYTGRGIRFVDGKGSIDFHPTADVLKPSQNELQEITDKALGYSGFSRQRELTGGYITYGGSCRIGICCDGEGEFAGRGKITSVCVRIPCSENKKSAESFRKLLDFERGLLVAGAPCSGKTTFLREVASYLTNGEAGEYKKVCLIDERNEISGGKALGASLDIIRGRDKAQSILRAVRLLSPQYVICDEIGGTDEAQGLLEGLNSGVRFIASAHAGDISSLIRRRQFRLLFEENVFDKVILLSSLEAGRIAAVYKADDVLGEICRSYGSFRNDLSDGALFFPSAKEKSRASSQRCLAFF